jgi:CheY-like chemotaxis protein
MDKIRILWADDEIDLLKPHIIFLEQKGYDVITSNNGDEAIDILKEEVVDIVFLDENMPGMSGIETLAEIKNIRPHLPVVMITKSEEESIMEDAIGSNISDYLIKPVKPNQILLSLKKNLENRKIVSEKRTFAYQQEFRNIGMELSGNLEHQEWIDIYKKLVKWELELAGTNDTGILEIFNMQKEEANQVFSKYIEQNYSDWVNGREKDKPLLSHNLLKEKLLPDLNKESSTFLILIDNLRYDQWKVLQPIIEQFYRIDNEEMYYSILPTTTQFARNAMFSGLLPSEIEKKYPEYWVNEDEEGSKNQYEKQLLGELLKRYGKDIKMSYNKILNITAGRKLIDTLPNLLQNNLNIIVYNFVDILSHARTEMEIIRELAEDEAAYRSLTISWFEHSPLFDIMQWVASKGSKVILTTDHGTVRVNNPVKVVGDRNTNTNLRYKTGKSLNYNKKEVFEVRNPAEIFLPRLNVSSSYVFCRKNDFFAYPNNYNYYVNYYKNTFQHGGISLEEILVPYVRLRPR